MGAARARAPDGFRWLMHCYTIAMRTRALVVALLPIAATALGCDDGTHMKARPGATTGATPSQVPAIRSPGARSRPQLVHRSTLAGRSVLGRPIRVVESGNPAEPRSVLVIGCIHGTETAGVAVTKRLISAAPPASEHLWIVNYLNPDGATVGSRVNAHGVDLNRNFAWRWKPIGARGDLQYSGPRPVSEPETRAAVRMVERIRPAVTVWFHQPVDIVRAFGHSITVARRFAHLVRLPFRMLPWLSGSASNWENHRYPWGSSFVVELPPGPLSKPDAGRYVRAIHRLAG